MKSLEIKKLPLDGTVCIEASAGTGKTFTIALIALRLIMERGFPISEIAVMTFTDAATAELSERIADFLREARQYLRSNGGSSEEKFRPVHELVELALEGIPREEVQSRLDDALLNIDLARIATIHGFCARALDEFAFETKSAYGAEVVTDQDDLILQILSDFRRNLVERIDPSLFGMVQGLTPQKTHDTLRGLLNYPGITVRGPRGIASECEKILQEIRTNWKGNKVVVKRLVEIAPESLKGTIYKEERTTRILDEMRKLTERSPECDHDILNLLSQSKIHVSRKGKKEYPELTHPFFETMEKFVSLLEKLEASVLLEAFEYLRSELKKRKQALRIRSFDDMITGLADAVQQGGEQFVKAIRSRFKAVLVDEFQDTDGLQYSIFSHLFMNSDQVFFALIGDPKQAIYRFRGGDIRTYQRAKKAVEKSRHYTIDTNYRSEARLIAALNHLYFSAESIEHGKGPFLDPEVRYIHVKAGKKLLPPTQGKETISPVIVWNYREEEKPDTEHVGDCIAESIIKFMDRSRPLTIGSEENRRALHLSDIAVLVRSHWSAKTFKRLFAKRGIRSVIARTGSVLESEEAAEVELILQTLLDPSYERNIRTLFVSRLFGYDLRALEEWDKSAERRQKFFDVVNHAKRLWAQEGIAAAMNHFFVGTGIFGIPEDAQNELLQERSITNYRHLIEILHQEEEDAGAYPERLIVSFQRMRKNAGVAEELEQRLESDQDAVTIITMHKAKGLQWPLVYAPELTKDMGKEGKKIGIYYEGDERIAEFSADKQESLIAKEVRQENMRLAYVTLTRAESLLIAIAPQLPPPSASKPKVDLSPAALLLRHADLGGFRDAIGPLFKIEDIPKETGFLKLSKSDEVGALRNISLWDPSRKVSPHWEIKSYTSLIHGTGLEAFHGDADPAPPAGGFAFPRGKVAGRVMHEIFERIEFTEIAKLNGTVPVEIKELIHSILRKHGLAEQKLEERTEQALQLVLSSLNAKIPHVTPGFSLGALTRERRISELEFWFSAAYGKKPVKAQRLRAIIGNDLCRVADEEEIRGFMNGFIDLVFVHKSKWYILDWKTDHLGNSHRQYSADALEAAMRHHNYHLQYHLYAVALSRYLSIVSGGKLDLSKDFGGVLYLFLRGVDGTGNGVYFARPKYETIMQIEEIL